MPSKSNEEMDLLGAGDDDALDGAAPPAPGPAAPPAGGPGQGAQSFTVDVAQNGFIVRSMGSDKPMVFSDPKALTSYFAGMSGPAAPPEPDEDDDMPKGPTGPPTDDMSADGDSSV
jgi:hypothetical protein